MVTVAATFTSPDTARAAVNALRARRADIEHVSMLMPGTSPREVERRVPTDEGESPGMGAAVGGVVGGALGLATASLVLPGLGPIVVAGVLAAGLAGAAGGGAIGDELEDRLSPGLPRDELQVYKDALARKRTVVIVGVETDADAKLVREVLAAAGAGEVDPARKDWQTGLREPATR